MRKKGYAKISKMFFLSNFSAVIYDFESTGASLSHLVRLSIAYLEINYFTEVIFLQISRYITALHEILAHTPHDHVERKRLQTVCQKLEDLSRQIYVNVSGTENIRKNLTIERMIVEDCGILLDVNQILVREGTLMQIPIVKKKSRIPHFKIEKETVKHCFLFTNYMIITTR